MQETQEQYDKRMTELKNRIDDILKAEGVALVARLHYTATGIMPVCTFIPTDPKSIIEEVKAPIIVPR